MSVYNRPTLYMALATLAVAVIVQAFRGDDENTCPDMGNDRQSPAPETTEAAPGLRGEAPPPQPIPTPTKAERRAELMRLLEEPWPDKPGVRIQVLTADGEPAGYCRVRWVVRAFASETESSPPGHHGAPSWSDAPEGLDWRGLAGHAPDEMKIHRDLLREIRGGRSGRNGRVVARQPPNKEVLGLLIRQTASYYEPHTAQDIGITFHRFSGPVPRDVTVVMNRQLDLTVRVVDADGKPVVGRRVTAAQPLRRDRSRGSDTDGSGAVVLHNLLPSVPVRIALEAPPGVPDADRDKYVHWCDADAGTALLKAPPTHPFVIEVQDHQSGEQYEVEVVGRAWGSRRRVPHRQRGALLEFDVGSADAALDVRVLRPSDDTAGLIRHARARAGTHRIQMIRPLLHGRLVDEQGQPVPGARVVLYAKHATHSTVTDRRGAFSIRPTSEGPHWVGAGAGSARAFEQLDQDGTTTLQLAPPRRIRLRVQLAEGWACVPEAVRTELWTKDRWARIPSTIKRLNKAVDALSDGHLFEVSIPRDVEAHIDIAVSRGFVLGREGGTIVNLGDLVEKRFTGTGRIDNATEEVAVTLRAEASK